MEFTFWINPNSELEEQLMPGLKGSGLKSLWVLPNIKYFSAVVLKDIIGCIVGLRCALWRLGTCATRSLEERELFHAFADRSSLINGFLVRTEITYNELVKSLTYRNALTTYSDVAWLAENQWELLSAFISDSNFGANSAIAFLPKDNSKAQFWGNIVVGYLWLALNQKYKSTKDNPLLDESQTVLSILKLSVRMGAIPTTVCRDSDMQHALILWGEIEQLDNIGKKLDLYGRRGDAESFHKWSNRGIEFVT